MIGLGVDGDEEETNLKVAPWLRGDVARNTKTEDGGAKKQQ